MSNFNLSQLDEGRYTLTARVVDTFNNERTRQWGDYGVDHTGPTVTLTVAPDDRPLQGEVEVEVLEDIRIRLSDAGDSNPAACTIEIGELVTRSRVGGELAREQPRRQHGQPTLL